MILALDLEVPIVETGDVVNCASHVHDIHYMHSYAIYYFNLLYMLYIYLVKYISHTHTHTRTHTYNIYTYIYTHIHISIYLYTVYIYIYTAYGYIHRGRMFFHSTIFDARLVQRPAQPSVSASIWPESG